MAALGPWEFGSEDIPTPRDYAAEIDELNEELARARDPRKVVALLKKRAALAKQAIGNPRRRRNGMRAHLRRNPGPGDLPYGEWIPTHAVRFNEDGTVSLMDEATPPPAHNRGRRRNQPSNWRILEYEYDSLAHKTHVKVETPEFTKWYSISGRFAERDALRFLQPTIERQLAEF